MQTLAKASLLIYNFQSVQGGFLFFSANCESLRIFGQMPHSSLQTHT